MFDNTFTICFKDRDSANDAVTALRQIIHDYGCAYVADIKDLAGVTTTYDDTTEGWMWLPEEVETAILEPSGYIALILPKPGPFEPKKNVAEAVDHPSHYQSKTGLEAWDVIEAFTSDLNGIEAFDTGNVLKYMCRWKGKNGLEDLKKAKRYLEHLIDHVENSKKEND